MDRYRSKVALWFRPKNYTGEWAVTLGQTTYYSCSEDGIYSSWKRHEDKHKEQWARDGKIKFVIRYLWQLVRKGYDQIDYEIEAKVSEV